MDLFKLGLRNILGITLPGAVLVLIVSYVLYVCAIALSQDLAGFKWVADAEFLILVSSFLISYIVGSVIRLNSASNVDDKSAKFKRKEFWRKKWKQARKAMQYVGWPSIYSEFKTMLLNVMKVSRDRGASFEVLVRFDKVLYKFITVMADYGDQIQKDEIKGFIQKLIEIYTLIWDGKFNRVVPTNFDRQLEDLEKELTEIENKKFSLQTQDEYGWSFGKRVGRYLVIIDLHQSPAMVGTDSGE